MTADVLPQTQLKPYATPQPRSPAPHTGGGHIPSRGGCSRAPQPSPEPPPPARSPPRVYCCKKLVQKIVSFVSNSSAILPRYISVNKKGKCFFYDGEKIVYIYFSSSRDVQSCNGIRWKIICKFLGFFLCTALTEVEGARVEGI